MKRICFGCLWLFLFSACISSFSYGQDGKQLSMEVPGSPTSAERSWLPRRLSESLGPYLEKIVAHAETRKLCPQLLEARLAQDSQTDNPKFIITCKLANFQTTNLIYSKQDVLEEFLNIDYEHKDVVEPEPAELIVDAIGPSRIDQAITACKQSVINNARDGDLAVLPDNESINTRVRQDSKLAVFVEYHIGQQSTAMNFTATCVVDENNLVAMEVYPH